MATKKEDQRCIKCNYNFRTAGGKKRVIDSGELATEVTEWLHDCVDLGEFMFRAVDIGSLLCDKCHLRFKLYQSKKKAELKRQPNSENLEEQMEIDLTPPTSTDNDSTVEFKDYSKPEVEVVELPLKRTATTHKYCCVCSSTQNLTQVPNDARIQAFSRMHIFIPKGNRCCKKHLIKKRFFDDELSFLRVHSHTSSLEVSEVAVFLKDLSIRVDRELIDNVSDYTMDENRLKIFTGLNWEQLLELRDKLTSMRHSSSRDKTQALVVFLLKLKSGNSNSMVASILGVDSAQKVSEYSASVIKSFKIDILSSQFGLHATPREDLIKNHTTQIAKSLHDLGDNQLILIADGTYVYHQKSANNDYQRKSYSGQKKRHLSKPFTVCMPDGYVVDVLGPFLANINDAAILKNQLETNEDLKALLKKDDVFVLDRGFRDVVSVLEESGFKVLMPSLKGNRKQLTTDESNHSRRVTKIRWAVEAVHGVIGQKYKLLHNKLDNKLLENLRGYCQIACYLNNLYGKRFNSDVEMTDEIVSRMKQSNIENTLAQEVESGRWSRRQKQFHEVTSEELKDFPEMTEKDLKIFFTGSYQLKQAISYLAEMIDKNGNINLKFLKETPEIIKVQIRSRHISSKTYNCYVHYKSEGTGYGDIKRWFCECANGQRTIGCCSHVAAVIYYLSNGRFKSRLLNPSRILSDLFLEDDTVPVIEEDSDDDD